MPLTAPVKGGGTDFENVSEGTHVAVCRAVVALGIQPGRGKFPTPRPEVYLGFEVPGERVTWTKDGKEMEGPKAIGKSYTLSMSEKANLRKHIQAWRGKAFSDAEAEVFDITKLAGQACLLTVIHSEDGKYANIASISGVPRGMPSPKLEGACLVYTEDEPRQFDELPKWLKEKIESQLQSEKAPTREQADERMARESAPFDDGIPFAPLNKRALWA